MTNQVYRARFSSRFKRIMKQYKIRQTDIIKASEGQIKFPNLYHWMRGVYPTMDSALLLWRILRKLTKQPISYGWLMGVENAEDDPLAVE